MSDAEKLKAIYQFLADAFGAPCNYDFSGESVAEYMIDCADGWCEKECGDYSDAMCWEKYLDLKTRERQRRFAALVDGGKGISVHISGRT